MAELGVERVRVRLPRPHAGQELVLREARRFNVVDCGFRLLINYCWKFGGN
jgi:hypothetical protein